MLHNRAQAFETVGVVMDLRRWRLPQGTATTVAPELALRLNGNQPNLGWHIVSFIPTAAFDGSLRGPQVTTPSPDMWYSHQLYAPPDST
jgi:hypothetical protein